MGPLLDVIDVVAIPYESGPRTRPFHQVLDTCAEHVVTRSLTRSLLGDPVGNLDRVITSAAYVGSTTQAVPSKNARRRKSVRVTPGASHDSIW
jgi:hypothetical protein